MDYSQNNNEKRRKKSKATKKKAKNKVGVIILRVTMILFVVGCFAILGAVLGLFTGVVQSVPDIDVSLIRPESYTSIIFDSKGAEIDRLHGEENREYAKLSEIPDYLKEAVVSIEDERFYSHDGIDFKGILRAIYVNITNMSLSEGASTITQQLIKMNILKNSEREFKRKIQEQFMAVSYEKVLSAQLGGKDKAKEYILEAYLNSIPLGHGKYGVKAAAAYYFNKELSELNLAESACLAGITQNPSLWSPISNKDQNKIRTGNVLDKMLELGYITQEQHDQAANEDIYSRIEAQMQSVDSKAEFYHSYFVDQVITDLANDIATEKNLTKAEAYNLIYEGGLQIHTTIDQDMQRIVDEEFSKDEYYPPGEFKWKVNYSISIKEKGKKDSEVINKSEEGYAKNQSEVDKFVGSVRAKYLTDDMELVSEAIQKIPQPQAGMVILDYRTGEVKAIAGGRGNKEELGQRPFNRATQAARQPGSVFKVLTTFAPGIDTGKLSAATSIMDEPWSYQGYSPKNHWGGTFRGLTTVRKAIETSANVVTVRALVEYVGIETCWNYLQNFGFTTLINYEVKDGKQYSDKVPAVALGGITNGVKMNELAAAYGTIANEGIYIKPHFYTKVLDHDGNLFLENNPEPRQVMNKQAAFIVTKMMEDVIVGSQGTGGLARFRNKKMPVSGKTGTTTDDKDLAFAGYTPYYAASIYMGHDTPERMSYSKSYHLILWRVIMERIHQNLEYKDFVKPDGVVSASVCALSGKLPVPGVCKSVTDYFTSGTVPTATCQSHTSVKVCKESGKLSTEFCPQDLVETMMFGGETAESMPKDFCNIHTSNSIYDPNAPVVVDPVTGLPVDSSTGSSIPGQDIQNPGTTEQLPNQTYPDVPTEEIPTQDTTEPDNTQYVPPSVDDFMYEE